jgi:hypothetical protein
MMQFNAISETIAIATNSIKEVRIERFVDTANFDRNHWMVYTPEGRLDDNFTSAGPFVDFESAKRNAEMNVGMKMNWSDF